MKKLILKKPAYEQGKKRIGYKLDYNNDLNPAQYEAVMHNNGAALVVAGAGTGKTRTLVYRVARLVEDGVPPDSILLLTFTRKAAGEALRRASVLLDGRCEKVSGGTFHSFALSVLRKFSKFVGFEPNFNVIDSGDSKDVIQLLRTRLKLDKSKRIFPRKETLGAIFNLSVNRGESIEQVLLDNYPHFHKDLDKIKELFDNYAAYKKSYNLMDYDDLLLNLHKLLIENKKVKAELAERFKYVMIDEYQDTNKLQHEIAVNLGGKHENVMAVGDDAQSVYSFRGAEFKNIIDFPKSFEKCVIFKIEENYRSSSPILKLSNEIVKSALFKYEKELFTRKVSGDKPALISAKDERQQSQFVVQQVLELREEGIPLEDIAVLARSGFLTFDLEIELNKANVPYQKFGGMKFVETAHIKDLLAYFKIANNPFDALSWNRALLLIDGVGPRTAQKMVDMIAGEKIRPREAFKRGNIVRGREGIEKLLQIIEDISTTRLTIAEKAELLSNYYKPIMKSKYDDWSKRQKDVDMFVAIADRYGKIDEFLNEMAVEPPIESASDLEPESKEEEFLTLSTIHSAKGLEWKAVFLIWALDGRFPSAKSVETQDSLEEERRLFYVACTRAKDFLFISYPTNIYDKFEGIVLSKPSQFLDGFDEEFLDKFVLHEPETNEN